MTLRQPVFSAQVQSQAAMVNLGLSIFIQVPSVIVSLLFGAWTDKNGRRPALFSPVIGSMAHCLIQLLVMYFNLPIYVLFLASFVDGCSGYIATMQQTSMAYVVDITSESNRIFRVGMLFVLSFTVHYQSSLRFRQNFFLNRSLKLDK